jgi:hypothetical protein
MIGVQRLATKKHPSLSQDRPIAGTMHCVDKPCLFSGIFLGCRTNDQGLNMTLAV